MPDVVDFVKGGRTIPNPNYNPRSKKNKEPEYIISSNPNAGISAENTAARTMEQAVKKGFGLSQYGDLNAYAAYGVTVNPVNNEEELNRERAKHQSVLEQSGRLLGQAVVNEVLIGSALGLSNIVDMGLNLFTEKGEDDYTNPVSKQLETWQEGIRERLEIYQKDPNQSWALSDFGWWASNFVSVASTASMLIPTTGIVKGVSLLGKAAKLNRISYGMAKAAKGLGITNRTGATMNAINTTAEIGFASILSRTMEGYLEARGVYNEVQESALQRLGTLSDEEREKLYENNPEFVGKTDEEIAARMSSLSADETFQNDYWMLIMDFVQFKALGSLWKGMANKDITAGLAVSNRRAIARLAGESEEAIDKASRIWRLQEAIKNPFKLFAVEWTEGLEEGYQGIQTEKGKEVAERMFDPAFSARTMEDYMTDPVIWEQAFWGILGGVGFQSLHHGLDRLSNKVRGQINRRNMTEEQYSMSQLTDEKIRTLEIEGRAAKMNKYIQAMNDLNAGVNPFKNQIDPNTQQPRIVDGNVAKEEISQEEAEVIKQQLTNELVVDMTLDATDRGNYELLKEYINNPAFDKYFTDAGINNEIGDKKFSQVLTEKMDNAYNLYSTSLYDVLNSLDVENEQLAKVVARSITRRKLNSQDISNNISDITDEINSLTEDSAINDGFEEGELLIYVNEVLNQLDNNQQDIARLLNNGSISRQAYDQYTKDLDRRRNQILSFQAENTGFGDIEAVKDILSTTYSSRDIDAFLNAFDAFRSEFYRTPPKVQGKPKYDIQDRIRRRIAMQDSRHYNEFTLPITQQEYQAEYDEVARTLDAKTIERYDNAVTAVNTWIESQDDLEAAMGQIISNNVPELQEALDILKIGHHSTQQYVGEIEALIRKLARERAQQEREDAIVTVDNGAGTEGITETLAADARTNIPTGNLKETPPANPAPPVTVVDEVISGAPVVVDNATEFVPIPQEEIIQNIEALDERVAASIAAQNQELILDNDSRAGGMASTIAFNLYRESRNLFDNLDGKDQTSAEFNRLVDIIAEQLFEQGVSAGLTRQAAITGLKLALPVIGRRRNVPSFITLADSLATRQYVEPDESNDRNAITRIIPDNEFNQVVEQFIDAYVTQRGVIPSDNNKITIDVADLFNELVNNNDISYEEAKYIFRNIASYIANNNSKKFIFKNTSLLRENINNADTFFQQLKEYRQTLKPVATYMHVNSPTQATAETRNIVRNLRNGDLVTASMKGNSISFTVDGKEIGYLGTVRMSPDGTSFTLSKQLKGFVRTVSKDSNGQYHDTFDDLFVPTINRDAEGGFDKIYDAAVRQSQWVTGIQEGRMNVSDLTPEMVDAVMNNEVIAAHIAANRILFPDNLKSDKAKAKFILNAMNNIMFYDNSAVTAEEIMESYYNFNVSTYANYRSTLDIQNALTAGQEVRVALAGIADGTAIVEETSRDINSIGLDYTQHPVVSVVNEANMVVEGSDANYINRGLKAGHMGLLIRDNPEAPVIALFTEANPLRSNANLAERMSTELHRLFKGFYENTVAFDELTARLSNLFGGPFIDSDNLFSGYGLVKTSDMIALNIDGRKGDYAVTIYRTRKGKAVEGTGIVYTPDGDKNKGVTSIGYNETFVNNIVKEVVDNLVFNRTFFATKNKNLPNTLGNPYLLKEDGKIIVNLGGQRDVYDNFAHFILANNAFKTNQGVNSDGGYFKANDKINSIYINPAIVSSPVEESTTTDATVKQLVEDATEDNPANGIDILNAAGVSAQIRDILSGNNEAEISLIPDVVLYDNKVTKANGVYRNGNVFLTKLGIANISKNPKDAIRILMHENFHALLEQQNTFSRSNLVEDLFDTYDRFVQAITTDIALEDPASDRYKIAKRVNDSFIARGFTYETYADNLSVAAREAWNARTEEERRQQFAEEWLVESLTQSVLLEYLNTTTYDGAVAPTENKSIWQKIIDVLLKLFGKSSNVIKNNTILAQQYSLLGNIETAASQEVSTRQGPAFVTTGHSTIAADYLFTGGFDVIGSADYFLQALIGAFPNASVQISNIRDVYTPRIQEANLDDMVNIIGTDLYNKMIEEIRSAINNSYNNNAEVVSIFDTILQNPRGMPPRVGEPLAVRIEELSINPLAEQQEVEQDVAQYETVEDEILNPRIDNAIDANTIETDDLFAATEIIESPIEAYIDAFNENTAFSPTGIVITNDMASFVSNFPVVDQQAIANMVNNNELNFVCE